MLNIERFLEYLEESINREEKRKEEAERDIHMSLHYGKAEAFKEVKRYIESGVFDIGGI